MCPVTKCPSRRPLARNDRSRFTREPARMNRKLVRSQGSRSNSNATTFGRPRGESLPSVENLRRVKEGARRLHLGEQEGGVVFRAAPGQQFGHFRRAEFFQRPAGMNLPASCRRAPDLPPLSQGGAPPLGSFATDDDG